MKQSTKWIVGIAIGLLCLVALVAIGYMVFSWWGGSGWMMSSRSIQGWSEGRDIPWQRMPMHPDRGMPFTRFNAFFPLRIVASGLLCLGLLALIVLGVFALARGLKRTSQPAERPVAAASAAQACSNCGRPVQEDWKLCPYCGNQLAEDPPGEPPPALPE
jgi:hypothetical protein